MPPATPPPSPTTTAQPTPLATATRLPPPPPQPMERSTTSPVPIQAVRRRGRTEAEVALGRGEPADHRTSGFHEGLRRRDGSRVHNLNSRLLEISRLLQSGLPSTTALRARSPSPEPIYDNLGIRINTREYRARERLNRERQEIISQLIRRNPPSSPGGLPPPSSIKLYIPMKEYPGYNFIGLIIGPRGSTQADGEGDGARS
ncbi:hypothetical protein ZWY2020_057744 [Hordeum vulgare]|nr:hypothetical protein ZWY2020_057744 [Hordeum vulgare]